MQKRRKRKRRKKVKRIRIAVLGSFTIDEIIAGDKVEERLGGSALYTSLGVYRAGGTPEVFSVIGKDLSFDLPEFIVKKNIGVVEKSMRFRIVVQGGSRKLILVNKVPRIRVNLDELSYYDGIIVNPVCKEVDPNFSIDKKIALDIQGLVRDCIEGKTISMTKPSLFPNKSFLVFHANEEELEGSGLSIEEIQALGFSEVIISRGYKGFTLYYQGRSEDFVPSVKGDVNVGNGDFLLGYYFTKRLYGLDPISASKEALKASEEFSIFGLALMSPPR